MCPLLLLSQLKNLLKHYYKPARYFFSPNKCFSPNIANINVQIGEHYPALNTGPVHLNISASPAAVLQWCSPAQCQICRLIDLQTF